MLLRYKKEWNTAICYNVDGSWEYHAKHSKSDGKREESYDFTHRWVIKQKAANEQTNKLTDTDNSMVVTRRKGDGKGEEIRRGKFTVTEGDYALDGEHTVQYTDDVQ